MTQRRGKGSPTLRAPSHRFKAKAKYRGYDEREKTGKVKGEIIGFVDDPGRSAILMRIIYDDGQELLIPAVEGVFVGDILEQGANAAPLVGSVLPLQNIPEGYPVFNIEAKVGDGGKLVRSSGGCAYIVTKESGRVLVKLPSKAMHYFHSMCRATIGCAAGGGRPEKPLMKAGKGWYKKRARGKWYPTVRGVKMNAYDHPFGGKQHHGAVTKKGKGGSPGQHVGSFGSKRTGRKKK